MKNVISVQCSVFSGRRAFALLLLTCTLSHLLTCSLQAQFDVKMSSNGVVNFGGFWATNKAGISNAVGLIQFAKSTNGTLRAVTLTGTNVLGGVLDVTGATVKNGDFLEGVAIWDSSGTLNLSAVDPDTLAYLSGTTNNINAALAARSLWLSLATNTFLTTGTTNISLKAHGVSALVNLTANDLQDLAEYGVFEDAVPTRVRVLRDENGYPLGSGRWFNKATTDSRTSDGITIILPIDVPSDASPGRWVLEGYEE